MMFLTKSLFSDRHLGINNLRSRSVFDSASLLRKEVTVALLSIIENQNPPPYEKLVGDLEGAYSRRINIQHRFVYQVIEDDKAVKVLRLWTHYE